MTSWAGIDVGGTKCLGVTIDDHGAVRTRVRVSTPATAGELVEVLAAVAGQLAPYQTLGVGVPGLVTRSGVLRAAPNLPGVTELPVAALLRQRLGHDVEVDNDATCAAVAEWQAGAGRGLEDLVVVTLGTGIGGGIISGGAVQRGTNGFAGEIGHMVVQSDGISCPCGRRGCWERYASGSALGAMDPERNGEELVDAARSGDSTSLARLEEYARWVALGLVNLTNLLDPQAFVLGGGVAASADVLLGPIQRAFEDLLYGPSHRPLPVVRFAELGEDAGGVGAAFVGAGR